MTDLKMLSRCAAALVVLAATLSAGPAAAVINPDRRIDGAVEAPWVASLWGDISGQGDLRVVCTGALIAPQWVATAAHCLQRYPIEMAVFAERRIGDGIVMGVDRVVGHEAVDLVTGMHDIGLVHLTEPVEGVTPLQLAPSEDAALRGMHRLELFGWGVDGNGQHAEQLAVIRVDEISDDAGAAFDVFDPVTMIGVGRLGSDDRSEVGACSGDSGGPVVATFGQSSFLVGVVAFGATDCDQGAPTVLTRVATYRNWLTEHMA